MRIKLDENVPVDAAEALRAKGHDVETVIGEGLSGSPDRQLVVVASAERRLLLTLDRGMADIRAHPPGSHAGIVVFRPEHQDAATVRAAVEAFADHHGTADFEGCIVVVRGHLARIRRPSPQAEKIACAPVIAACSSSPGRTCW